MATPLNIVLVEDHDALREVMIDYLCAQGYAATGIESAEMLGGMRGVEQVDLYVLDLNLPGEDGISLARRLRLSQPEVGIIMLSARTAEQDKVRGYAEGADIYLTKPTSCAELTAAIQALTRRLHPEPLTSTALRLDMQALTLSGALTCLDLSQQEAALLAGFARARDRQLEIWEIMELQGKTMEVHNKAALEVQIVRLRKKLLQTGNVTRPIKALRGWGYQLCVDVLLV